MPSTAKQAETTAWEAVRATPFAQVHCRLTRHDYKTLMEEAATLASLVEDITYKWSQDVTNNYGLLADILGTNEYYKLTSINSYTASNEPVSYAPTITNAMLTHERKHIEKEWELVCMAWSIRRCSCKA